MIRTSARAVREAAKGMKIRGSLGERKRLDIRPTQSVPIIRKRATGEGYEFAEVRWGFDVDWMKNIVINAKAESMAGEFWSRAEPCLVPASGYYDWPQWDDGSKPRNYRRYLFSVTGQKVFFMAGLWRPWATRSCTPVDCMAIGTTEPNRLIKALPHERMPAILNSAALETWLALKAPARPALLQRFPSKLMTGQGVSEPERSDPKSPRPIGAPLAA